MFTKKTARNIWWNKKNSVPLHPQNKNATNMVPVVQLVRASDCGSECRGFESHRAPFESLVSQQLTRFFFLSLNQDVNLNSNSFMLKQEILAQNWRKIKFRIFR